MFLDAGDYDEGLLFLRIGLPVMIATTSLATSVGFIRAKYTQGYLCLVDDAK